ncbi:hypothetical protein K8R33_04890 [archaeon]|nr:hypothetical protein [archaeon]
MKYLFLVLILFMVPVVDAYSFDDLIEDVKDFFDGYIDLTGDVVLKLTEESTDFGTEHLEDINPKEIASLKGKTCKDSDLIDYSRKGICKKGDSKVQDYCSEDKTMVMEFYCNKEDFCVGSWYVCSGKCLDGVCVG